MIIDCIRTSASRPDMLEKSTKSILKHIKFSGKFRYMLHEDYLNKKLSDKCVEWATKSGVFEIIKKDLPKIGQGSSIFKLFSMTESELVLNWEDDWELIRDLDFDNAVKVMNENSNVNQICFHKRNIMSEKPNFIKKEVVRSGFTLTTNPHWAFIPALWRRSFIANYIFSFEGSNIWSLINTIRPWPVKADWMIENVGTYYWGGIGSGHYVNHLGQFKSVRTGEMQQEWENK